MKTTRTSILLAMAFILVMPVRSQDQHEEMMKQENKGSSMTEMMGAPTFEKSQDGLHIALWLMTQEEHEKMMDERMKNGKHSMKMDHGMMHESMDTSENRHMMNDMKGMDHGMMHDSKDTSGGMHMMHGMEGMDHNAKSGGHKSSMDEMMAGTHHIMVTVTDDKSKKDITDANVAATFSIEGKQSSTVALSRMMNHFGGGLVLHQKSTYTINIVVTAGGKSHETQFSYEVK